MLNVSLNMKKKIGKTIMVILSNKVSFVKLNALTNMN